MKTVYSEDHKLRDAQSEIHGGEIVSPFECPRRAEIILGAVQDRGLGEVIAPDDYGLDPVLAVHDRGFVDFLATCAKEWAAAGFAGEALATCWPTRTMGAPHIPEHIDGKIGYYALAAETSITTGTWLAALASKNVALSATDLVLTGAETAAFGLCRPPGHHAAVDQFGGYCFLNNAAIAAEHALSRGKARIAILDVDFHHGNGTQNIFYGRDDVLFLSVHGDPLQAFPYFLGHAEETGTAAGEGFTQNYPLPPGATYELWCAALQEALERVSAFAPDLLIVSLGVDTYERDPISFFKLTHDDFFDYGRRIGSLGLPTVYLMEGGYAVDEIGINTTNVLFGHQDTAG
ncbi:histone deacetylase family protein [Tropicimonas marinistellae]|uniref:histone deacetylase family protein n=1 Tax=Tropicimonas marinistellae TaxID=1739787 RepID=UPI00083207A7|nr:histone deacetylase family protein [Tropicimonas marinistellae]